MASHGIKELNQTQQAYLNDELQRLNSLKAVNKQLEKQLLKDQALDSEQLKQIIKKMQDEQGLFQSRDLGSHSAETDENGNIDEPYKIIHIVESSNGDDMTKEELQSIADNLKDNSPEPSARKVAFDGYMAQKIMFEKLLTGYLSNLPSSSKVKRLLKEERIQQKQHNYLQKQMYRKQNQDRSKANLQIPDPDLISASKAQLHSQEYKLSNNGSQKNLERNMEKSPRGQKHDGLLKPSYNLKLYKGSGDDRSPTDSHSLMRIAQIIQENYNDNKAPNADLEALELKETEKLIDNIMSMQIRITEEADAISKDDSKTADVVDDSGTLGVYPTPMRTFTLAKDQSTGVTPQDHTADGISPSKKVEIKHRDPPSILIKSNTTVHLGVDSSQRITDTHQSVNLNRIASAEWNPSHQNHLQVSFNQVPQMTPKMKEISLKRKLSAISLERMRVAGASVSLRGSSQISHLAGLSPTMRPVNINQGLIDFSIERSKELKADNQASSSNLRKMKENNNQHSPFIAGQAITLQSIAKQSDKSKKFSKRFKENGSMKSIRNLTRVGSNLRSSGSIKKSDRSGGKSPQKQQDPADWWRGGLADITDVAESKSATKHGTMGDFAKEINRDPKFKHNLPNLVSGVQSISQTKTILQVDLSEGQTPRGDNLTPFARSTGGHLGSNVQARQTQQESFDKNQLQTRHFESLASLRESLQEPDTHVRPSPYTSNHASQKSLKKHTLYRGTQRTSIAENNHLVQVMRNPGKDLQLEIPKMSGFQVNSRNIKISPPLGEFSFKELIIPTVHYEAANGSHQKTFGSGGSPRRSPKGLGSSKAQQLGKKSPKVKTIQDVLNQYISQQTKQERKQQELDKYGPQKMKNYRKKVRNNAHGGQFYIHQTVINTKQKD